MENADPIAPGEAQYSEGMKVLMSEDAEMYAGEEVRVLAVGKGRGPFYQGRTVYDVVPAEETYESGEAEEDDAWRVTEDQIEGAV